MTMITPSYLGETIEYSSLHACRSTLEDPTVAGDILLWPRLAGGAAKGLVGQTGEHRRRPAGVWPPRQNERPRLARAMEGRSRTESRLKSSPASRGRINPPRPRFYLVTPLLGNPAALVGELDAALAAGDIAAVLLRLEDSDERTLINRAKTIAAIVQRRDIALLLDGRSEIAARAGVDGAHLTGTEALIAAAGMLKPDRIAGAGGLRSRHDAMLAGESGADYVMFGEPDRRGNRALFEAILERIRWWAEVFEPPCVGYAANADEVGPLVQAGADFVALGDWIWTDPTGPVQAIETASAALLAPAPERADDPHGV